MADDKKNVAVFTQAGRKAWEALAPWVRALFKRPSLEARAQRLGGPLNPKAVEELFGFDPDGPEDSRCAVCGVPVTSWWAAVVDDEGNFVVDVNSSEGDFLLRGPWVVRKDADSGEFVPLAFCPRHLALGRKGPHGQRLPAQAYAQAVARATSLNEEQELRSSFMERFGNKPSRTTEPGHGLVTRRPRRRKVKEVGKNIPNLE